MKTLTMAETQRVSGGEGTLIENTFSTMGLYSGGFVGFMAGYAIGFPCAIAFLFAKQPSSSLLVNEIIPGSILLVSTLVSTGIGATIGDKVGSTMGGFLSHLSDKIV